MTTSISDVCGNTSFVLLGISFGFQDVFWLRSLALMAGASMLMFNYYHPYGKVLWLPLRWNLFFCAVNTAHILLIYRERQDAAKLDDNAMELYDDLFAPHGMSLVNFHRLLKTARWETYEPGTKLTEQGTFNHKVYVMLSGDAQVGDAGSSPLCLVFFGL